MKTWQAVLIGAGFLVFALLVVAAVIDSRPTQAEMAYAMLGGEPPERVSLAWLGLYALGFGGVMGFVLGFPLGVALGLVRRRGQKRQLVQHGQR